MNFYSSLRVLRKSRGKIIERFFFIHRTAMVIRTLMRLSTGLFTAYPQMSPGVTECFLSRSGGPAQNGIVRRGASGRRASASTKQRAGAAPGGPPGTRRLLARMRIVRRTSVGWSCDHRACKTSDLRTPLRRSGTAASCCSWLVQFRFRCDRLRVRPLGRPEQAWSAPRS